MVFFRLATNTPNTTTIVLAEFIFLISNVSQSADATITRM
jgi:hypothetical protein